MRVGSPGQETKWPHSRVGWSRKNAQRVDEQIVEVPLPLFPQIESRSLFPHEIQQTGERAAKIEDTTVPPDNEKNRGSAPAHDQADPFLSVF